VKLSRICQETGLHGFSVVAVLRTKSVFGGKPVFSGSMLKSVVGGSIANPVCATNSWYAELPQRKFYLHRG